MNIKLRLKNKVTLVAIIGTVITFVYQILGILGITVPISEDQVINVIGIIINLLVMLGVVVDPTTAGVADSTRAKGYVEPFKETELADDYWEQLPEQINGRFKDGDE